jgi:hypothetical protein
MVSLDEAEASKLNVGVFNGVTLIVTLIISIRYLQHTHTVGALRNV